MVAKISKSFKDISLSFKRHPITNDLLVLKNESAIKNSIINLVKTTIGQRFFNPTLGSRVSDYLFELANEDVTVSIENEIRQTIINFEPRVLLSNVTAVLQEDKNEISVEIKYDIVGQEIIPQVLEFVLQPTRV